MENKKTANGSEQQLARSLEQLNAEVDWDIFLWLLRNTRKMAWIPPWDDIMIFKATLIQEWNCLSEKETEEIINDRLVLHKFLKMASWEKAPDENNIRLFKAQIGKEGMRELFDLFDEQLENFGLIKWKRNYMAFKCRRIGLFFRDKALKKKQNRKTHNKAYMRIPN